MIFYLEAASLEQMSSHPSAQSITKRRKRKVQ